MKQEIKDSLVTIMNSTGGQDSIDQMLQILELPDTQFDALYPQFSKQLKEVFMNSSLQKEIIEQAKLNPPSKEDIEEAKASIKEFTDNINLDDTLSKNKRELLSTLMESSAKLVIALSANPRERINVKIQKINPDAVIPSYAHDSDAGADIFAVEETTIKPHTTVVVKTGIKVAIPDGYEIQIRPRSGLSLKTPLRLANCVGTIDAHYRGEIGVILENTGNLTQVVNKGDKIAQMVISPIPMIEWDEVEELDETDRGNGGFGSTDKS